MQERPLLYFALGVLLTTSLGAVSLRNDGVEFPDGSVQTSADSRRAFYLTESSFWIGGNARVACDTDAGFHMASLWEILDPSELRYVRDDELSEGFFAHRVGDSGSGPPVGFGWIRTGRSSNRTQGEGGEPNCDGYTYSRSDGWGTIVSLRSCWEGDVYCGSEATEVGAAWNAEETLCTHDYRVWCVQD